MTDIQSLLKDSQGNSSSRRQQVLPTSSSCNYDSQADPEHIKHPSSVPTPLASAFAKRCYFTKAGIAKTSQHYEGLTLTGDVVLMLAAAMKLKGCPTICDEDLRRVEQTFPTQFSRLPDELLLSSGWRRISKYCHFSNKPIPDGIPFFHSKLRLHPSGGYYFLLAAAVGLVRPMDVEPLTRDTLVLLETDYPTTCDSAPPSLIQDPDQWTLVDKFCFFSGGPINTDENVYYEAELDGGYIYMLAFLSPSLTPSELYKLDQEAELGGLKSVAAVDEVDSVYDLTERDFADLQLYHLGPCRALPQYILQPLSWTKVLPPHFLSARQQALRKAQDYERAVGVQSAPIVHQPQMAQFMVGSSQARFTGQEGRSHNTTDVDRSMEINYPQEDPPFDVYESSLAQQTFSTRAMCEISNVPVDEAMNAQGAVHIDTSQRPRNHRLDPPEDEPPSLRKDHAGLSYQYNEFIVEEDPSFDQSNDLYPEVRDQNYDGTDSDRKLSCGHHKQEQYAQNDKYYQQNGQGYAQVSQDRSSPLSRVESGALPFRSLESQNGAESSRSFHNTEEMLSTNRQIHLHQRGQMEFRVAAEQEPHASWDDVVPPERHGVSGGTWESEMSSAISESSSWTEDTDIQDRSLRRALILQMAKSRMKTTKTGKIGHTVPVLLRDIDGTPGGEHSSCQQVDKDDENKSERYSGDMDAGINIDFTEDLD